MKIKEKAINYFECFSNKDIQNLEKFFSNDVYLRDWDIEVRGIEKVIKANANIFQSVETIKVTPIKLYFQENTVIAELEILINNLETLKVVDILTFDELMNIKSIKAFKG